MAILIDGYNVLNATGVAADGAGPGTLERARQALLNFLAGAIEPGELPHTTVVFDAREAPPGLPRTLVHRGLTIRFAARDSDADTLIEELIRADSAPRRLTVVSSDHRIQRAAHRRRARAVDSDVWCAELAQRRHQREDLQAGTPPALVVPLLEEDVNYWVRQFGGQALVEQLASEQLAAEAAAAADMRSPQESEAASPPIAPSAAEKPASVDNPFPPGYAEDLLKDDIATSPFPPGYATEIEKE